MYEPTRTTYSPSSDEALIAEAIENLPRTGERHHTIVNLEHQTVCLSVARAPADADCWEWYSAAAAERAELTSERLLPLVSAGNFDGWFYVAHDIGAAVPLSEYRRGITEISTARSLALLLGIAHALDDAVRQGKPPCEVTPDAVFLDPRLGAMIGDTGVAREALGNPLGADDPHAPWIAPEVLRGEDPHPRSPVYSFGAIAYTLLTGGPPPQDGPPRVSRIRTDLPATLDTVFAVAMAPEPQKRYATAAEARHLLNLVIYGAPSLPSLDQAPRFRRGGAAQQPSSARPASRLQPAVSDSPRAGRILVGLLIAAGLAGGAIAGMLAAGGDTAPPPNPRVSAAGMSVELPRGWNQQPAEAGRLEAHPQGDLNSGLAIAATRKPVAVSDQATAVQLGEHEAWRQDVVRADNGSRVAAYVIPTRSGKVEVTCTAATGSPTNTLALCERTASTLDLGSRRPMTLIAVANARERWRAAASSLQQSRASGRRTLAAADRQTTQIAAAESLARSNDAAARRFAKLFNGDAVARAARRTAAAYRALARAARGDSPASWASARSQVSAAEARLSRAVAGD